MSSARPRASSPVRSATISRSDSDAVPTVLAVPPDRRPDQHEGETVASLPVPRGHGRRAVLGTLALAAVGTPLAIAQPWANAAPTPLWSPDPAKDGIKAFEGVEADRANRHPGRKYVYVEGDHWRFGIYKDDPASTRGGDPPRTNGQGHKSRAQ